MQTTNTTNSPESQRPTVVCLCGSTRFSQAFQEANWRETRAMRIVLTIGVDTKSDDALLEQMSAFDRAELKLALDRLHLRKIDLADEILILNVDDYIGDSTRRELEYARQQGKRVRWLEKSTHALPLEPVSW